MKVAMYYKNDDVRIEEMEIPKISEKELLVKVMASGICGSDVLEWYRIKSAPKVLGHEIAGVIEKVGSRVKDFKEGQRVFISHHVPCGECHLCLQGHETACETLHSTNFFPGGFAQYIRVPEINVRKGTFVLPESVSFEEGTFIEPLACVVRGQRLAEVQKAESVLVLGSGISGLLHIKLAKAYGVKKIFATDISEYRLKKAEEYGAVTFNAKEFNSKKLKEKNGGLLADSVILCTGAKSAVEQALTSVERGGTVLFFAVPEPGEKTEIDLNSIWRNEITLKTSYAAAETDLKEAIELISGKKLESPGKKLQVQDLITHKLLLEEVQKGFELVEKADESVKVILEPNR